MRCSLRKRKNSENSPQHISKNDHNKVNKNKSSSLQQIVNTKTDETINNVTRYQRIDNKKESLS